MSFFLLLSELLNKENIVILYFNNKKQKQPFIQGLFLRMCAVSENKTKTDTIRRIPYISSSDLIMIITKQDKSKTALF